MKKSHWEQMRDHAARESPIEACGLVAGMGHQSAHIYKISNEANSPTRYRMAPKEQLTAFLEIEKLGWDLLAIYHSHPAGPAVPSAIDLAESTYPEILQLIFSPVKNSWQCRAFSFKESNAIEINIELLEDE